jgi:hypothetical protein
MILENMAIWLNALITRKILPWTGAGRRSFLWDEFSSFQSKLMTSRWPD